MIPKWNTVGGGSMDELLELLDYPNETLGAEYKDWLELAGHENRANLARHMAALANHGGGYIVFGFANSSMLPTGANPFDSGQYDHDGIAAIARKYLEPAVHCDVRLATSSAGNKHVVVVVPSHGATPICAKQNGPMRGGKPRGIVAGVYYTRKTGPESAPILTAAEWYPIIRRCAMHERTAILGGLSAALAGGLPQAISDPADDLAPWHEATRQAYERAAKEVGASPRLSANNFQLSYSIHTDDGQQVPPSKMMEIARELNMEIRDRVNTGWSIFFPFQRDPISPYFTEVQGLPFGPTEVLEANLMLDAGNEYHSDFWRLSSDGKASIIRPYGVDYLNGEGWTHGSYFSLNDCARHLGEVIRHAEAFAERFDRPEAVSFRCEWGGLKNRELKDANANWSSGQRAHTQSRITQGTWAVGAVSADWPSVIDSLMAPLTRAFAPTLHLGPSWVRAESHKWRPIGDHYP